MINLFNINNYTINTSKYNSLLNDPIVEDFENQIASYVGAKYACSVHSATMAIFLSLIDKENLTVEIPTIIPPVVPNAILCAGQKITYRDDIDWVGSSYILHDFGDYKIIDSAQQLEKNQFSKQANDSDLMIFSFYPTKPVGSVDGGMFVSNDPDKIERIKVLSRYGMTTNKDSWQRDIILPGWKMYMNSIQADIALNNFKLLESKNATLEAVAEKYNSAFSLQNKSKHLYRIRVSNRKDFMRKMEKDNIQCGIHYKAVHNIECYQVKEALSLEKSMAESAQTVSIPFHEKLTHEEVNYIIEKVKEHAVFARK